MRSCARSRADRGDEACGAGARSKDDVAVAFDDNGTEALATLAESGHRANRLLESIRGSVAGACSACASAHTVNAQIVEVNFERLDEKRARQPERYLAGDHGVMNYWARGFSGVDSRYADDVGSE